MLKLKMIPAVMMLPPPSVCHDGVCQPREATIASGVDNAASP